MAHIGGTPKLVQAALFDYQKARMAFMDSVQTLLDKEDPDVLKVFLEADILSLLACPLIQDVIPTVQIAALNAVAKLVRATDSLDTKVTKPQELEKVVPSLSHEQKMVQCAGNNTLQAIAGKSFPCAQAVIGTNILPPLHSQLVGAAADVKESTVKTLNTLVGASPEIANSIMDPNTLNDLVYNLRLPEASDGLKAAVCTVLANTSAYSQPLAERVVATDAIVPVARLLSSPQALPKLRSSCLMCLAQIAKHTDELAQKVVGAEVMQSILASLIDANAGVRNTAAILVHEIGKKTPELAEQVAADGGITCLVKNLRIEEGSMAALPTVLTIGFLSDFSSNLAMQAITANSGKALIPYLRAGPEVRTSAAWSLGTLARHGPHMALPLAEVGALPELLNIYKQAINDEQKQKSKVALKNIIHNCGNLTALEPLLADTTPPEILRHILSEFATGLPESVPSKRDFVTKGALMRLQELCKTMILDDRAKEDVKKINALFPAEVVAYYN